MSRIRVSALLLALVCAPLHAVDWPWPDTAQTVIGEMMSDRIRPGDTLVDMARMHNLGYRQIRRANPDLDVFLPEVGAEVRVPLRFVLPDGPYTGVILNLAEKRLYYFPEPAPGEQRMVVTYPVGIGRLDRRTPTGEMRVVRKLDNPAWYPTPEVIADYAARGMTLPRMVPPGPDNPLGEHAIILDQPGYLLHGTHRPAGIGMRVSQGCVRLYPEDIRSMIQQVEIGAPVRIVDQPLKAGVREGRIYVEAHPPADPDLPVALADLRRRIVALQSRHAGELRGSVDWDAVAAVFERQDGVATAVMSEQE